MTATQYEFEGFSTRISFNKSLRHFKKIINEIIPEMESKINLADFINIELSEKAIAQNQLLPTVRALLYDKYQYQYQSINLPDTLPDLTSLNEEIKKWDAFDIVFAYHHPELGFTLINPKNEKHLQEVREFKKHELITVYLGGFNQTEKLLSDKNYIKKFDSAFSAITTLLSGKKKTGLTSLYSGQFKYKVYKKAEPEAAPARSSRKKPSSSSAKTAAPAKSQPQAEPKKAVKRKMVGPYGVVVSNELFHNGNVEAWKKIIQSYHLNYPGLQVHVFYDGERILDINSLFKWGKVKHGSTILISVSSQDGTEIKDIAKLRRYLMQGASHRFEDFLRGPVGKVLDLF